jgi:hypothetical protein
MGFWRGTVSLGFQTFNVCGMCRLKCHRRWGFLSRAGLNDKSQLCRQIEKYADVYTSRVSNFLRYRWVSRSWVWTWRGVGATLWGA